MRPNRSKHGLCASALAAAALAIGSGALVAPPAYADDDKLEMLKRLRMNAIRAGEITAAPKTHFGKDVTVTARVTSVLSNDMFVLDDGQRGAGKTAVLAGLLVMLPKQTARDIDRGDTVTVQ